MGCRIATGGARWTTEPLAGSGWPGCRLIWRRWTRWPRATSSAAPSPVSPTAWWPAVGWCTPGDWASAGSAAPLPDAGTVFRIASMTKSFTATMVLALRDEGALRPRRPGRAVRARAARLAPGHPGRQRVRIRHLLTMTAGFPTDDPWGDREAGHAAAGVRRASWPGASASTGRPAPASSTPTWVTRSWAGSSRRSPACRYPDSIEAPDSGPAGPDPDRLRGRRFDPDALAPGYRRGGRGWAELSRGRRTARSPPWAGCSAASHDLARWVAGFAAAWPPGDGTRGRPHPLSRAAAARDAAPAGGDRWRGPRRCPAPRGARAATGSGCSSRRTRCGAGSCTTAAATRASAATCAGTRPPASASSRWATAPTRRCRSSPPGC